MNRLYSIFSVAGIAMMFMWSCGSKQVANPQTPTTETNPKPHWVQSKPSSSIYFHGIGIAQKQAGSADHMETAKKNALSDLASEIKVNVSSNSILYTLERDYKFESEFIETIRTSTNEDLEGYEVADTWENESQYWIFYRLNRADYYAKKEAEKKAVMDNAADFYQKGLDAWDNQQVTAAFDLQARALAILKPYWAENNMYSFNGKDLLLDNSILGELQHMANTIDLSADPAKVVLSLDNDFEVVCTIKATDSENGKNLAAVPVAYRFQSGSGLNRGEKTTGNDGEVKVGISNPDLTRTYHELETSVDLIELFDPRALDTDLRKVIKGLHQPRLRVPIELKRPVFYLQSQEQNLYNRQKLSHLRDHLSSQIIKNGLPVSQERSEADIIVNIDGKTREGGESNGFSIAYLDMSIQFTNPVGNAIYFEQSFNDLKGVSNTTERAGLKAFDKGTEKMDRAFMEKVLKAII